MKLFLQMFSDAEAAGGADVQAQSPENGNTAEAEFEELIKGKYADAFKSRVQGIIDKRFSKMKGLQQSLDAYAPMGDYLKAQFPGINGDDIPALVSAFLGKSGNTSAGEVRNTVPSAFKEAAERELKMKAAENVRAMLLRDEKELRRLYPSFDLKRELSSSPELCRLISAGVSLRRAYEAVNMDKIMGSVLQFAVMKARYDTAESIKRNTRIQENSLSDRASSVKHTDVNNLTENEIRKIIADVGNGARITF